MTFSRFQLLVAVKLGATAAAQSLTTLVTESPGATTPPAVSSTGASLTPPNTDNSAFQCWSSLHASRSYHDSLYENRKTIIADWTYTYTTTTVSWDESAEFTTLCDGIPRAVHPPLETTNVKITSTRVIPDQTSYVYETATLPEPSCSICNYCEDCDNISRYLDYESSRWLEQPEPRTPPTFSRSAQYCVDGTSPTPRPPPPTSAPPSFPTGPDGDRCFLTTGADRGTLYYWPVTTVSGDFCAQDGTTLTPTPTASDGSPNTAVYNGYTLTSPSALLIVDEVRAALNYRLGSRTAWTTLGVYPTSSFSLHPSEISSVKLPSGRLAVGWSLTKSSFNFDHMNTVPYKTYSNAHCERNIKNCDRVWEVYQPNVEVPPEFTKFHKELEYCTPWGWLWPTMIPITAGVTTDIKATATPNPTVEEEPVITGAEEDGFLLPERSSFGW